jgi:5-methylcytosine-specific restriction endonuclease McrA
VYKEEKIIMKANKYTKLYAWREKIKNKECKCVKCGRIYYLTIDHIIPESLLLSLNLENERYNWEENFEVVCGSCNARKGGKLDLSNPKTMPLLKEAIKRAEVQKKL